jgi:hypothetical protein
LIHSGGFSEKFYGVNNNGSNLVDGLGHDLNNASGDIDSLLAKHEAMANGKVVDAKHDLKAGEEAYYVPDEKFYDCSPEASCAAYR